MKEYTSIMETTIGEIRENSHADIYWQRSFVHDKKEIQCKIIVCASIETLSDQLHRSMNGFLVDQEVIDWFSKHTHTLINHFLESKNREAIPKLIYGNQAVQAFAETL